MRGAPTCEAGLGVRSNFLNLFTFAPDVLPQPTTLSAISSVADHTKKHNPGGNISTIKVECFCCGKVFEKELRVFKAQKKSGQTRFYCNRVCMGRCNATKNFRRGEVIHGSSTSYQYWKCRCNICRTAHAERRRQWYAKRKNLGVLV